MGNVLLNVQQGNIKLLSSLCTIVEIALYNVKLVHLKAHVKNVKVHIISLIMLA